MIRRYNKGRTGKVKQACSQKGIHGPLIKSNKISLSNSNKTSVWQVYNLYDKNFKTWKKKIEDARKWKDLLYS